jgi:glycopeptide antibiotics resistance protein
MRTVQGMRAQAHTTDLGYLLLWVAVIVMVGMLPLSNFVGHSHWEYIKWVPTIDNLRSPKYLVGIFTDLVENTLLFLPFGYFLSRLLTSSGTSRHLLLAGGIGGMLSTGIEFYQVYCHSRFPSILDIIANITGALLGVRIFVAGKRSLLSGEHPVLTPIPPDRNPAP